MDGSLPVPVSRPGTGPAFSAIFPPELPAASRRLLEGFPRLVDTVFPLPGRFRAGLHRDVAELSRLLTSGRGDRPEGYLGRPPLLSAYLRYFLPWNLYRLVRLLPLLPITLTEGDAVTDLGSGPLTLPLALWMARPEFRSLALEFRCLDRTEAALKAGKRLFTALAGPESPWKIRLIHASLAAPVKGPPAALVTAVNVYNEIYGDIPHTDSRSL
ncbi:MAG: rRNA methyltransferase, partial [Treponema sp.]|nr:rRNA methyltransferase [Treponema sp.]